MKNIELSKERAVPWDGTNLDQSLEALREYVEREAIKASDWYLAQKATKAFASRYLRLGAILCTAAAALTPIGAALFKVAEQSFSNGLWASFLVGTAAGCVGVDRAFGFSTGWIRYITTATIIRRGLEEFRMSWALKRAQTSPDALARAAPELIELARSFRLMVDDQVLEETRAWATEFQNNLAQLEREVREQSERRRAATDAEANEVVKANQPGAIELTVPNALRADNATFIVMLSDGRELNIEQEVMGSLRWVQLGLEPRGYRASVSAKSKGALISESAFCEVRPSTVTKVELSLPMQ